MIDVEPRDIEALEKENQELRAVLEILLETPNPSGRYSLPRKALERINYQLAALETLARQLWEQKQIHDNQVENPAGDFWSQHP